MKYKVGWRDLKGPGQVDIEAENFYEAKKQFLDTQLKDTKWEQTFIVSEWLPFVSAKCSKDNRRKESLPDDFLIETFLKEVGV